MQWEVEQKFPVADSDDVKMRLDALGVQWAEPLQQTDHYFNHPCRDFAHTDEALRLRQQGDRHFITYKGPKVDPTTKTRHELEFPLNPAPESFGQFSSLLQALGFQPAGIVAKTRRPGRLVEDGQVIEIALDSLQGLGDFLELEIVVEDESVDAAKTALQGLASRLGLGASERRSYLELIFRTLSAKP